MVEHPRSPYDELTARCPMLGHLVPFTYCMKPASSVPCRRVMDCWHERIDIVAYLEEVLTPEEMETLLAPPRQKVSQLVELIEKAKKKS
jgi:hypothetical protein